MPNMPHSKEGRSRKKDWDRDQQEKAQYSANKRSFVRR